MTSRRLTITLIVHYLTVQASRNFLQPTREIVYLKFFFDRSADSQRQVPELIRCSRPLPQCLLRQRFGLVTLEEDVSDTVFQGVEVLRETGQGHD